MINFRKLISQFPDDGPDVLFDQYMREHGYEDRWFDADDTLRLRWLGWFDATKENV